MLQAARPPRSLHGMRVSLRLPFALLALATATDLPLAAAELPIIAKARAYLADEATLQGVQSVRFVGTLSVPDQADATKEKRIKLDVIFAKPDRQLMRMAVDDGMEITGLDGYEAWQLAQDGQTPPRRRLTLLPPPRTRRLLAETRENLLYFRGLEKFGGTVEDQGVRTIDGIPCQRVAFIHSSSIAFYRHFELATGRLVLTEIEDGRAIREHGEIKVQGVRFPSTTITTSKDAEGKVQTVTLTFDKITLNEPLPPKYFAVPTPTAP